MKKIIRALILILIGLLPLFFLPLTQNFFGPNKKALLFLGVGLALILGALDFLLKKKVSFVSGPLVLPLAIFSLSLLVSLFFSSGQKSEAFFGRTGAFLSLIIFYFLLVNFFKQKHFQELIFAFFLPVFLLSWLVIFDFLGVFEELFFKVSFFSPAGSFLVCASFLLSSLPFLIVFLIKLKNDRIRRFLFGLITFFVSTALILMAIKLVKGKVTLIILPLRFGWQIALQSIRDFPLLGLGPENFGVAFSQYRSPDFNSLAGLWNLHFNASSNLFLELMATTGLFGLGAILFLFWRIIKAKLLFSFSSGELLPKASAASLLLIFVLFFAFPVNFMLLFSFFFFLALLTLSLPEEKKRLKFKEARFPIPVLVFSLTVVLVGSCFFWIGKIWAADYFYYQSLKAAAKNLGKDTYQLQQKAIRFYPHRDSYRIAYSQTNLALAKSLAKKTDLGDQERKTISQLVQQAVREARVAVGLSPQKFESWQNLANVYQSLTGLVQGVENWLLASYWQAVKKDPANPLLRISLGQVYYNLADYDRAIEQFRWATRLKPDLANAFYNLAYAYKKDDKIAKAVWAMEQTKIITCNLSPSSDNCQRTTRELKELQEKIEREKSKTSEEEIKASSSPVEPQEPLALPSPATSSGTNIPPIELPSLEATPEPSLSPTSPLSTPTPGL